jgi:hypothetical protein
MDRYEEAFYAEERKKERERLKDKTVTSAIEFVIWVDQFDPSDDEMANGCSRLARH